VLGGVIADAAVAATRDQGAQVGFMNPGGIRRDLEAGEGGVVTFGQAQAVLPFGNTLVVMDLTGAQLRRVLEQQWDRPASSDPAILAVSSGLTYEWDGTQAPGRRVAGVKVDGVPLADDKTYRVVANNFLAGGGDNIPMFAQGTRRVDTGLRDLDALIAYLQKHPELGGAGVTAPPPRIRKVR
jgi:5'-nucleotidase